MVFRRYGRRRFRRPYHRRYRNTLSTRNVFSNRSSRAQASQIAALRKRTNILFKRTRKEIETGVISREAVSIAADVDGQWSRTYLNAFNATAALLRSISSGTFDGDKVSQLSIRILGDMNTPTPNTSDHTSILRLVLLRAKSDSVELPAIANGIIRTEVVLASAPFVDGITDNWKVVKDWTFVNNYAKRTYVPIDLNLPRYRTAVYIDQNEDFYRADLDTVHVNDYVIAAILQTNDANDTTLRLSVKGVFQEY